MSFDITLRVPSFCPICDLIMKGNKSTASYYDFGCCANCHIEFIEHREEKWKSGWRPSQADIDKFLAKMNGRPI